MGCRHGDVTGKPARHMRIYSQEAIVLQSLYFSLAKINSTMALTHVKSSYEIIVI